MGVMSHPGVWPINTPVIVVPPKTSMIGTSAAWKSARNKTCQLAFVALPGMAPRS